MMGRGAQVLFTIYRRELAGYFHTATAYVFLAIFLFAAGAFTFHIGGFFEAGQADLAVFFAYHPWLYLVFMPALAMRLWAEEIRSGSIEVALTLPAPVWSLVIGKFLAAWSVAGVALLLTAPAWFTVNYLGDPDNGAIFAAYLGSLLMAGGYVAVSETISAATGNQVVAFVIAVFAAFILTAAGLPVVVDAVSALFPTRLVEGVAFLSPLERFESIQRGVIEVRDVVYFFSLIAASLSLCALLIDSRRGG